MTEARKKRTILFVDDDIAVLQSVKGLLGNDWELMTASSGKEALGLLEEYSADMVISNMVMPEMDGVALLKEVRDLDPVIVRILVTDDPDRASVTKAFSEAEIKQVIAKPWNDRELAEIIRTAFLETASQEMELLGLHRIISEIESLPPVPRIYAELCQVTEDPQTTSTEEVAKVISRDPAVAAKIMQIANSAFFGQRRQVETVSRAVVVLGLEMVKNLVLATSVFQTFETNDVQALDQEQFWKHCLACGMSAALLERKVSGDRKRSEIAMLAGTIHDLGKLVFAQYMPERYAEVVGISRMRQLMLTEVEEDMLGTTHAAVGGYLAEWWNLPVHISEALHWHHEPSESGHDVPLASVVHLADIVVHRAEIGFSGCGRVPDVDETAVEALGVGPQTMRAVEERIAEAAG